MKNITIFLSALYISIQVGSAQTSKQEMFDNPEKTAGVYYAYPEKEISPQAPVPKGYEPFYISHFSRHGSRYLVSDDQYKVVLDLLQDAANNHTLSALGKDVFERLKKVWQEAEFRGGDLSPLGVRQHRGIAERMYTRYPQIFVDKAEISAQSTTVLRCALSMDAFSERLKELNPKLLISRDASMKYQRYLNFHTNEANMFNSSKSDWRADYDKFENNHINPSRMVHALFTDSVYIQQHVNQKQLFEGMYEIAGDMQNIETKLNFYDVFEKQELFDLWQCRNYKNYVSDANSALNGGIMFENAKPILRDILERAEKTISTHSNGAAFRFAHDGNIIPLAMLLHLEDTYNSVSEPSEFYKAWSNFKIAPMAANIQIVFFRKPGSSDIIVKFLLNENEKLIPPVKSDILPYYHWKDIEAYYKSLLGNKVSL
ncbi:hypothetical protein LZQ00_11720 [Sphingobacterium sp. SRCM116780]|uniref:histidine-type phosphatase n=1 Tax=Sphingobacterium sp. SRCM116780 TaxID=2907623 RepID=UPI001F2148AE|nr:histidine-type phosphatase [Sphingobacterium sp. SRCM116780]UIR54946.1 hypothetical protein LZQ00_11720 [Sphingobacterium sp. SRCM116780]